MTEHPETMKLGADLRRGDRLSNTPAPIDDIETVTCDDGSELLAVTWTNPRTGTVQRWTVGRGERVAVWL